MLGAAEAARDFYSLQERIEKLVDLVNRPAESFISMGAEPSVVPDPSVAQPKDTRHVEILQGGADGELLSDGRRPKGEIVEETRRLGLEVSAEVVCHFAIFAKTSFEPTLL